MFLVFFLLFFFIISKYISIFEYLSIRGAVAFILAYEIFCVNDGEKKPIIKYFYKTGMWLQKNLFTIEPTDQQLQAAISTMKVLIELEADEPVDDLNSEVM